MHLFRLKTFNTMCSSPPWQQTQWQSYPHCNPSHLWISSPIPPDDRSVQQSGKRRRKNKIKSIVSKIRLKYSSS